MDSEKEKYEPPSVRREQEPHVWAAEANDEHFFISI